MIKRTITCKNFDGEEVKKDLYFHFTKAELIDMELGSSVSLTSRIQKIMDTSDVQDIIQMLKELVLKAYGVKSEDGMYFRKKDVNGVPYYIEFEQSALYSEFIMSLIDSEDELVRFIEGLLPDDILEEAKKKMEDSSK